MQTIPTVNLESADFNIRRMEDIQKERKPDEKPHRHGFYTLLIPIEGSGEHIIDFHSYPITPPEFHFVSPGQVHQVQIDPNKEVKGFGLFFNAEFLIASGVRQGLFEEIRLFATCNDDRPIPLSGTTLSTITSFCESMINLQESDDPFQFESIGAMLKLILIEVLRISKKEVAPQHHELAATESILRRFKEGVEKEFRTKHKVKEFAEMLAVSPGYLNEVVKTSIGKTAKEYLQERLILEAKRLALFSEMGSSEVAYKLGFDDPAHFSRFFKNQTDHSFGEWKSQIGDFDKSRPSFS